MALHNGRGVGLSFNTVARGAALVGLLGWFLLLPLADIVRYPERLSVLPNLETDAAAYDAFARTLAETGDLSALAPKHPPGWMAILAGVYATVGHSYVAGKVLSWLALTLSVLVCAAIAQRVFGRSAAVIASILVASSPGLRAYVGTLQYEVVTAALFALFLLLCIRTTEGARDRHVMRRAALAGAVGGALVLTRETFVLVVPIAAGWVWQHLPPRDGGARSPWTSNLAAATLVVVVAATPAVAWSAAQTVWHGRLILIADKAREVFDAGHNPRANGTYNEPLVGIGEPAGFAYISQHPLRALTLTGRKFLYSFGVLRDGWNVPHAASIWIWRASTGAIPLEWIDPVVRGGWLLVCCGIGLWLLGRAGLRRWWILPASCGAILALHIATLASYRFTVPLLPMFYVLASGPLASLAALIWPVVRMPAVAAVSIVMLSIATAAQFQSWPLAVTYDAADLEGLAASNERDSDTGRMVRIADAARGERPVALLPDTYLPRGPLRLTARVRTVANRGGDDRLAARVMLVPVDGVVACTADIALPQLDATRFTDVAVLCELPRDGPATLAVISFGTADLAIDSVRLAWTK
jgi:4-amino-4-deoxy-L-arabinose transferase-like glycosyltransferase